MSSVLLQWNSRSCGLCFLAGLQEGRRALVLGAKCQAWLGLRHFPHGHLGRTPRVSGVLFLRSVCVENQNSGSRSSVASSLSTPSLLWGARRQCRALNPELLLESTALSSLSCELHVPSLPSLAWWVSLKSLSELCKAILVLSGMSASVVGHLLLSGAGCG